jgi:small subunit ribosomal protein S2
MQTDGTFETFAKRERLQVTRQRAKLEKNLGSIADLNRLPAALFIIDVQKENNAVKEANRLSIPVIAVVDTCCDPTPIDFVIPANDDAATSIALIMDVMCSAIAEGNAEHRQEKEKNASQTKDKDGKDGDNENKRLRSRKHIGTKKEKEDPAVEEAAPATE